MASFPINTYQVTTTLQRFGTNPTETRRERTLELISEELYHGIVVRATIAFSTGFDGWNGTPVVGYYSGGPTYTPSLVGWFPLAEFPVWLDILRNEQPLQLFYDFAETPANYLNYLALGSGKEPPGEGPADHSSPFSVSLGNIPGIELAVLEGMMKETKASS